MKNKNIVGIIISIVVVIAAGALLYRYFAPPSADSSIKVEVPAPVNPEFNTEQLNTLKSDKIKFYDKNINPTSYISGSHKISAINPVKIGA